MQRAVEIGLLEARPPLGVRAATLARPSLAETCNVPMLKWEEGLR